MTQFWINAARAERIRARIKYLAAKYSSQMADAMWINQQRTLAYFGDGRCDEYGEGPELISTKHLDQARKIVAACEAQHIVNRTMDSRLLVPPPFDDELDIEF